MNPKTHSFIEHLDEFRSRLIKSLACVMLVFIPANFVSLPIITWIKQELCPGLKELVFIKPMELFFTQLKVSFCLALIISTPFIAYQIWSFVSPALFKKERHNVLSFVFVSTFLFLAGAALALFIVFPAVIRFSLSLCGNTGDITPMINIQSFINLAGMLMLAFGLMFQLPIVVFILTATGIISTAKLAHGRPYVIVVIFILAAVLTPGPDIISQLAMAIPTCLLFEASLIFCKMVEKKKQAQIENIENNTSPEN